MNKILALVPYVPNPPHGGGEQRVHHVLTALAGAGALAVFGLPRASDQTGAWPLAERFAAPPRFFSRGPNNASDDPGPPLKALFPGAPTRWPGRVRTDCSRALWEALEETDLADFDAVHVESLGMIPYGVALKARAPHLRLTLDLDNIDSVYAWRGFRAERPWWASRRAYWAVRNVYRLFAFARRWLPAFDAVWVCSETDRQWVLRKTRQRSVFLVPNGIDCEALAGVRPAPDGARLVLTGTMMEGPNSDGMVWFTERVWPEIRRAVPGAEFWCVGRDPCSAVRAAAHRAVGVHLTGSVPDVCPYLARASVSVAPIRYGTGTRLKILEAMAAGLPVVSTRLGAEGLDFRPDEDLVLADRPGAFARACIALLTSAEKRERIAAAGRRAVQKYDWSAIYRTIRALGTAPVPNGVRVS
jgi:polysaccharide biosynthesis protein PslH